MYSVRRTRLFASVIVAVTSGLVGAALAQRAPASCECRLPEAAPVYVLPEVEVVAKRLPSLAPGE